MKKVIITVTVKSFREATLVQEWLDAKKVKYDWTEEKQVASVVPTRKTRITMTQTKAQQIYDQSMNHPQLTPQQIASANGVSRSTVSRILEGTHQLSKKIKKRKTK